MKRNVRTALALAAVVLVMALPPSTGCNNNGPSGSVITPGLHAGFTASSAPTAANVTLQPGAASGASDTINVDVIVNGVSTVGGVSFKVAYNRFKVQFVGSNFTTSFLTQGLSNPPTNTEFQSGANALPVGSPVSVDVYASRMGDVAGVTPAAGANLLGVLTFRSLLTTGGVPELLTIEDLNIKICTSAGVACTDAPTPTSGGGSVTAN